MSRPGLALVCCVVALVALQVVPGTSGKEADLPDGQLGPAGVIEYCARLDALSAL